jgi:hypothetical protein
LKGVVSRKSTLTDEYVGVAQAAAGEVTSLRERLEAQEREAEGLRDSLRQKDAQLREQAETIADLRER